MGQPGTPGDGQPGTPGDGQPGTPGDGQPGTPGAAQPGHGPAASQQSARGELITFGHGTASADEIVDLLHGAGIEAVVDVRTAPGSRRNPHVARAELERWLPASGIAYRWEKDLGGFRRAPRDSPDVAWREEMFRGYAAYMRQPAFRAALDGVLADADVRRSAVMCSESVWWRCHRRMIADFVSIALGRPVRHLMHDGRLMPHRPSPGARLTGDGLLVYDAGQSPLPRS